MRLLDELAPCAADRQPLRRRAVPLSRTSFRSIREIKARGPDLHGHHQRRAARAARARARRGRHRLDRRLDRRAAGGAQPDPRAGGQLREGRGGRPRGRATGARSSAAPLPMQIAILPVTELNMDAIAPAVEALRELPLDTINVGLRWFVPESVGRRVRARDARGRSASRRRPGRASSSTGTAVAATKEQQMTELVKLLKGLKRRRFLDSALGRPWTSFVPDVPAEKRARVLLRLRRRPSATTCARSPGTSRRSSRTARSASAATFPTTSSATCASSRSARSGRARRRSASARSSRRSRCRSAPAAAATTSTGSGSGRRLCSRGRGDRVRDPSAPLRGRSRRLSGPALAPPVRRAGQPRPYVTAARPRTGRS